MSKLTLTNLNLPNNPTARRLLELIGEYQVRFVLLEDGVRFTSPDLSEAKGHYKGDFKDNFLSNLTTSNSNGSSSNPDDVWVLEGDSLKEFKDTYKYQLGISLGKINKLTVVGWNTAYHYLVQGHSETAKDFSNLAYDHFLKDLTSKDKGTNANNENLPPLPNNATARRFMELVEQYNLNCYEWVEKFWYIGSDLCEAKGSHKWDFANNFLGTNPKYEYLNIRGKDSPTTSRERLVAGGIATSSLRCYNVYAL